MQTLIRNLAVSLGSGAAVGYITNSVAVTMLFKKFFGRWGGVVETYYEEFITSISELVETDLLNHTTLKDAFSKPELNAVLAALLSDIFNVQLPQKTDGLLWSGIPGAEQSIQALCRRVESLYVDVLKSFICVFPFSKLSAASVSGQLAALVNRVINQNTGEFKTDIQALISPLVHQKYVHQIISHNELAALAGNVQTLIARLDFLACEPDIDALFKKLCEAGSLNVLSTALENAAREMPLGALPPAKRLPHIALGALDGFTQTTDGAAALLPLFTELCAAAGSDSAPFSASQEAENALVDAADGLAGALVPPLLEGAAALIRANAAEVEALLNEAIDAELEEGTLWGGLLKSVKDVLGANIARDYHLVDEIETALAGDTAKTVDSVRDFLHGTLRSASVGALMHRAQEQQILNVDTLAGFTRGLIHNAAGKELVLSDDTLSTPLGALIDFDFSFLHKRAIPALYTKCKQSLSARSGIITTLAQKAADSIINLEYKKIEMPPVQNCEDINNNNTNDASTAGFIWNWCKDQPLNALYTIPQKNIHKASGIVNNLINTNLEYIVSKNVSKLIYAQLHTCSPAQINTLVRNFMGRELKPINILGAFLGALAGAGFVLILAAFNVNIRDFWPPLLVAVYCVLFAGVGIGTNALALRMLFRPYKKIIFNIPPFVGVVARRKNQFATGIATFVRTGALSKERLRAVFDTRGEAVVETIKNRTRAGRYALFDSFLNTERYENSLRAYLFKKLRPAGAYISDTSQNLERPVEGARFFGAARFLMRLLLHYTLSRALANNPEEKILLFIQARNEQWARYAGAHTLCDIISDTQIPATVADKLFDVAARRAPAALAGALSKKMALQAPLLSLVGAPFCEAAAGKLSELLPRLLAARKADITKRILARMNFAARMAFGAQVPGIVARALERQLPLFLRAHTPQLRALLDSVLQTRLADCGIDARAREAFTTSLAAAAARLMCALRARAAGLSFFNAAAAPYTRLSLVALMSLFDIHDSGGLCALVQPVLPAACAALRREWERPDIQEAVCDAALALARRPPNGGAAAAPTLPAALLHGIDSGALRERLAESLGSNSAARAALGLFCKKYGSRIISKPNAVNFEVLKNSIYTFFTHISDSEWKALETELSKYMHEIYIHLNTDIADETKDVLLEHLLHALLKSFRKNMHDIINALDIQTVIENEINAMHPAEIEKLFYRFAGRYFNKIILYGWLGCAGGLVSALLR